MPTVAQWARKLGVGAQAKRPGSEMIPGLQIASVTKVSGMTR
jgi:hypothetical protein